MSGFTPIPISRFRDQLGSRGLTIERLADDIGRGRSHVSQVLWGHRAGGDTWARIRAVVTDEEWATLLQMEHCATWNAAQLTSAAPDWVLRVTCAWCRAPMGFKACRREQAGATSHGICPTCYTGQLADLDALAARQVARDVTADSFAPAEISECLTP